MGYLAVFDMQFKVNEHWINMTCTCVHLPGKKCVKSVLCPLHKGNYSSFDLKTPILSQPHLRVTRV